MNKSHLKEAVAFGRNLIKTQDLDPVYTALNGSGLKGKPLARVFLAYTCLYHLGASTIIGQDGASEPLWEPLQIAATNYGLAWPRGSERRHWRGANAQATVNYFKARYETPEDVVSYWGRSKGMLTFNVVSERVRELPAYGPWIAFKVADMLERVMGVSVDFSDCALGIYDEPRKAAALILTGSADEKITDVELSRVVQQLGVSLGPLMAPPRLDRRINVQEIETVLCKYKSHVNGHYPHGKDTREVLHGLQDARWDNKPVRQMIKTLEALPYAH